MVGPPVLDFAIRVHDLRQIRLELLPIGASLLGTRQRPGMSRATVDLEQGRRPICLAPAVEGHRARNHVVIGDLQGQ